MIVETVNKNRFSDFISKEHKYINKIEAESDKITNIIEKRLPKTESIIKSLDFEKAFQDCLYNEPDETYDSKKLRSLNNLTKLKKIYNDTINIYKDIFNMISVALKEVVSSKNRLISYAKAYRAARKNK